MKTKIVILLLITVLHVQAEIRFVSKTGTSKPPYTNWATAADSIQKAIDICKPGDTVYVGNGSYEEQLFFSPGIALIGSGNDSCIVDTRKIAPQNNWWAITFNDSCTLGNINLYLSQNGSQITGIRIAKCKKVKIINNKFINCGTGISIMESDIFLKNNIFLNNYMAFHISDVYISSNATIEDNIFSSCFFSILSEWGANSTIRNNLFFMDEKSGDGIDGARGNKLIIENNLMIANKSQNYSRAIATSPYDKNSFARIVNNTIYGDFSYGGIISSGNDTIINNHIYSDKYGIFRTQKDTSYHLCVKYNNIIGQNLLYTPDSTNIFVNPMFYNPDSLDFRLQKYSPLIDAGDPNMKDADGTRSDIGIYGGPLGESYVYKDLAPRAPVNLKIEDSVKRLILKWNKNSESDFAYYRIYKDTVKNFKADPSKKIAEITDANYFDNKPVKNNVYYKITAIDKQENESALSEEAGYIITGVEKGEIIVNDYALYQNYPNPFNPSTKIGYKLKEKGKVRLTIYDIQGKLVETILNNVERIAGYYEEEFPIQNNNLLASGIYICRIEILNAGGIPVFNDSIKMLFLK